MRDFNDQDHPSQVLICNIKANAFGVNLQGACHVLIFTCPDSIGQLIQVIGRVHRIGQKHPQKIWLLTNLTSYDNWLQASAATDVDLRLTHRKPIGIWTVSSSQTSPPRVVCPETRRNPRHW